MNNPQAFPQQNYEYDNQNNVLQYQDDGMTLLDYFAAKAMQSIYSQWSDKLDQCEIAHDSYSMAIEMLKRRQEVIKELNNDR